ncbi:alpha/beta hydrolase [Nitrospirillum sp. BR 11163]|uniref:alpha/beta hydrolase n=1 Tax=Nitrospirillum sp. BR 11163 TaxID=3104323 RepID=UPI002AFE1D32|nr:alpha/beta hydrolase [Nitrospirillum sp. BR 11163]MEA1673884.1 alpha/beta hydrolase [Nitrospirillum sp. BR 11163]
MTRTTSIYGIARAGLMAALLFTAAAQAAETPTAPVGADGGVTLPLAPGSLVLPFSSYASPEARTWFKHYAEVHAPPITDVPASRAFYDRMNSDRADRLRALYPVTVTDQAMGGVPTQVVAPAKGPVAVDRVLINLHGGAFLWGAGAGGLVEAVPVAALSRIKVVTVDYRQGPEHRFPTASEDVAAVYKELLKTYEPQNIGIYGCSAGGILTAEAVAWFQTHGLPRPGAIGIFCAGLLDGGGDSQAWSALYGGQLPGPGLRLVDLPYFQGADAQDPLVLPGVSPEVLAKFPPTLLITGTRDFMMSDTVHSQDLLERAGVRAELHVWDGMVHSFFSDPESPEARAAYDVMARFFTRELGRPQAAGVR